MANSLAISCPNPIYAGKRSPFRWTPFKLRRAEPWSGQIRNPPIQRRGLGERRYSARWTTLDWAASVTISAFWHLLVLLVLALAVHPFHLPDQNRALSVELLPPLTPPPAPTVVVRLQPRQADVTPVRPVAKPAPEPPPQTPPLPQTPSPPVESQPQPPQSPPVELRPSQPAVERPLEVQRRP